MMQSQLINKPQHGHLVKPKVTLEHCIGQIVGRIDSGGITFGYPDSHHTLKVLVNALETLNSLKRALVTDYLSNLWLSSSNIPS